MEGWRVDEFKTHELKTSESKAGDFQKMERDRFLFPRSRYHGQVKPENLVFNANLQEFAQRAGFIANLETAGKLSPADAYQQIQTLWQKLENSAYELGIASDIPV